MTDELGAKLAAARAAGTYRPLLGGSIVALSLATALLEGVGVGFVLPVVEVSQSGTPAHADGLLALFVRVYGSLGLPFTLESLLVGVAAVMALRFAASFAVGWLRALYTNDYERHLRERLFEAVTYAPVEEVDEAGSDDLLNGLVTETNRAAAAVYDTVDLLDSALRAVVYLVIAALISLKLTLVAGVGLGASTALVRYVLEPAYVAGDEVAEANSRLQRVSQTGVQGTRDVRLYTLRDDLIDRMRETLDDYVGARVRLMRNRSALGSANQFANALVVFGLVYVGVRATALSLAEVGVFLFAVFRLSPTLTGLNDALYALDGTLPHLVRVRERVRDLDAAARSARGGDRDVASVSRVAFEDVTFAYDDGDPVVRDVSLSVERGEHVAIVGQSGAGKSTLVSLLARLRTPDSGRILADGTPVETFDVEQWRERLAVVRQNPYVFPGTLRENVTVGNPDASREEIRRACERARVTEFLDELDGYETELGDEGVRLSGGQRQRVAIARALLKDADVLVLDEATSELDATVEREVYDGIRETGASHATVTIAHRLSTVSDADRIYALADGEVVEVGTHRELVADDGVYADLYASQS